MSFIYIIYVYQKVGEMQVSVLIQILLLDNNGLIKVTFPRKNHCIIYAELLHNQEPSEYLTDTY